MPSRKPKRFLFIVNPVAGGVKRPWRDAALIREVMRTTPHDWALRFTEGPGHARTLAVEAAVEGYDVAVALGGDGTVNETASGLLHSDTALGVIPAGSGNGFAREMGVPLGREAAIRSLVDSGPGAVDVGVANGRLFLNVCGTGLDALVSRCFNVEHGGPGRHWWGYVELAFREFFSYAPPELTIEFNGTAIVRRPMSIVAANTRQFGVGAIISARAKADDGLLNLCVHPFKGALSTILQIPSFFRGRLHHVPGHETWPTEGVRITAAEPFWSHTDGEPFQVDGPLEIRVIKHALRIFVPRPPRPLEA